MLHFAMLCLKLTWHEKQDICSHACIGSYSTHSYIISPTIQQVKWKLDLGVPIITSCEEKDFTFKHSNRFSIWGWSHPKMCWPAYNYTYTGLWMELVRGCKFRGCCAALWLWATPVFVSACTFHFQSIGAVLTSIFSCLLYYCHNHDHQNQCSYQQHSTCSTSNYGDNVEPRWPFEEQRDRELQSEQTK